MQYVRSISGSVSKTWNSINPATLSGAIDVIVIEQEDGEWEQDGQCHTGSHEDRVLEVLSFPRPVWKVLSITALREEGTPEGSPCLAGRC